MSQASHKDGFTWDMIALTASVILDTWDILFLHLLCIFTDCEGSRLAGSPRRRVGSVPFAGGDRWVFSKRSKEVSPVLGISGGTWKGSLNGSSSEGDFCVETCGNSHLAEKRNSP